MKLISAKNKFSTTKEVRQELKTWKAKIKNTNELLILSNQKLQKHNELLKEAYDFSEALLATIHEPMLVLDKNLRVKSANKTFYEIFKVKEEDTNGYLLYDLGNGQWNIPKLKELFEDILPNNTHFHNFEITHHFPLIGEKTMLLNARRIIQKINHEELILLAISDISEQAKATKKMEESAFRFHNLIYTSPFLIAIFKGENFIIEIANDAILESWGKGKAVIGKPLFEIMPETEEQGFDILLKQVYNTGEPVQATEVPVKLLRNGKTELMHYTFVYQAERNANGNIEGVAIIATEVSAQVEAKNILIESEERFHFMADTIPLNVFIIEPTADASISYWNKHWLDYTGQTIEEALGRTWNDIVHPEDVQSIMDIYVPAFEKRLAYRLPSVRIKRHDGQYRWFTVQANPRYLPNGEFKGFIGIGFDIHDQKLTADALKASEQHFRLMADLMPAKISNSVANGDVFYFNKQWMDFSGYNFEELKDLGYQKMMHPDEIEEFQQRFQHAAHKGTVLEMEMRFKNKLGEYKWHLNLAAPVKDENGKITMWVGVTTKIQQQKEQRDELEAAVANRTYQLREANESLEEKNIALEHMNKELEAFTFISSHDLQEPLRKIQTFAGRILEKENQNLSDNGKNYFYHIQKSAKRMQILIQDLLAFSHLTTAERKFENTDLNVIIREVKKEFRETIIEKNAVIEVEQICDVRIIRFQFRQLMHNLIGNALKFSNPNVPLRIKIKSYNITYSKINLANVPPNKEYCHISVEDNGIGFEKKFEEKIFEVFQKLHSKDEYAGTGIGLAIVKKIVENHNGIITANSELNKGTKFDIYIPVT